MKFSKNLTLANTLTIGNLVCGALAIIVASFNVYHAAFLVFAGFFFDVLDGFVARKMKTVSAFGKELDSLADIVTFGVAPVVIAHVLVPNNWLLVGAVFYLVAAGWRLARHNVLKKTSFLGLPAPAAALILLAAVFFINGILIVGRPPVFFFIELVLAILMVSTIKIPKVTA
ncbi:CDP-diacylglycerol--serine O-phosphatidyltransferase, partial [Candidatus Woesearchaeota archaeon]|nr:CDP-diacylglycerol--serine O-phosphatidyltransferase [Candidatus Woesearchaeota archaeon]